MEHNNKVSEKVEYFSRLAMKESLNSVNKTIIHPIQQHKLKCQNEQTVSLEEKFKNKENINFNLKLINDQQISCNLKKLYPEMLTRKKSEIILKLTENLYISEMINNEDEIKMIGYLQNRFNNFVVYKFNQQLKTCFKKIQCFGEPEMSLEFVIMVCKSVKGWLEFDKNCIFVFEKSGNQTNFLFLVLCIMKMLNFAENPLNILSQKYQIKMIESLLKRRLNEFTCILEKGCETKKQLLFYQIIFSTKTGKLDSFSEKDFILKIFCENKVYEFNSKEEPHFKDEFYLIFFLKELPVKGEVKLILFSENKEIFVLNFNTFFYESGIFRLEEDEIDFINQKKNSQIWLDIAFKENKMINLKVPYSLNCTLFENLQIICDHYNKNVNLEDLNELSKQFNKNFAKFVLLQEISLVDLPKYIETLPSKIEKKIRFASMNFAQNKGNETLLLDVKIEKAKNALEILTVAPVQEKNEEENYKINNFEPEENYQNETLEVLTETNFEEVTTFIKTNVKRPPPSFKKKQEDLPTVFARKPLHLTGMMSRDSIFNDISDLQVKFDTNTFEEWFCDPIFHKEKKETITPKEEDTSVLDQSKVFLAQLAVKNLEKAQINFMNLEFYLTTNFEHLKIEDLKNMQKLFLQENEILKIQNYSSEKIDPLEKQMIKYSKNTLLKNIIFILIFDKKISEESLLLKNTLEKYKINFNNLLENKVLKLILKLALELCNAVNYKYTLNKKRVVTFRMSLLKSLQSYKGKSKEQNLLTFLVNQLKNKKEEIINEIHKLTAIQNLKEINLEEIRNRINEFIIEHSDCTKKINFIEEDSEIKQYLKKVLSCAYHFLKELKEDYLKVEALAYKVRCKFCDCNDESVKSVLSDLSVFFKDFKEEFEKCTIL